MRRALCTRNGNLSSPPLPLPASSSWLHLQENHTSMVAPPATPTLVFTGTDSYYVEYLGPAGLS